jgi:hypothetical protein
VLGPGPPTPTPKSPIPNPQSPIPIYLKNLNNIILINLNKIMKKIKK